MGLTAASEKLLRGWARVAVVACTLWLIGGGVAHADPPGPTDYLTEIVSVTPAEATDAFDITVEGGDAFLRLAAIEGHVVEVPGYDDEPYLRFEADGRVLVNERSPSHYYNEERYGGEVPADALADADPEWRQVADDGVYAWHDHRAHWMSEQPLVGLEPGDALPRQVVDLVVDGVAAQVEVETTLQPEPSVLPLVFGALVGVTLGGLAIAASRPGWALAVAGLAITAVGVGQYVDVPPVTGPSWAWIAFPSVAGVCGLAVLVLPRQHYARPVLLGAGGMVLVFWAVRRGDVATAAYIPNALGAAVDRLVTAVAPIAGLAIGVAAARAVSDAR